ncbi:MAG: NAD(P)/FAD-dependent oxidoreductase [Clostridia bacterium]
MNVIVIGGGASGMIAAGFAARNGNTVSLIEKNEKLGKKVYITGKGRCNVTNVCLPSEFLENVVSNPKFLMSAIHKFNSDNLIDFLEKQGLGITIERGDRAFPSSNRSSDVINTLQQFCVENNVKLHLNTEVYDVLKLENVFYLKTNKGEFTCDKLIIATGGMSYPSTGSTGDGYKFAKKFGHNIIIPLPALCPIFVKENWVGELEGLSLKNVTATVVRGDKVIASEFGEMLFTDKSLSGPIILTLSSKITRLDKNDLKIIIDLKPALSEAQLDQRLLREFTDTTNRDFKNCLGSLLPKSLIPVFIKLSGIEPLQKVNQITAIQREKLVFLFKNVVFSVKCLDKLNNAIITSGGVSTKEINPKTMESKIVDGLYFTGEVIDIDALTGGFNLQVAFSTGYLAGTSV